MFGVGLELDELIWYSTLEFSIEMRPVIHCTTYPDFEIGTSLDISDIERTATFFAAVLRVRSQRVLTRAKVLY